MNILILSVEKVEERSSCYQKHLRLFKYLVVANALVLLTCCSYALYSLYQLEHAMRGRGGSASLVSSTYNIAQANDSVVISDFNEWRRSILRSLESSQQSKEDSANLRYLLHTIGSIVRNFVDEDGVRSQRFNGNSTVLVRNKLIIANLTDMELHMLREFARLKMLDNRKYRVTRTVKGGPDESGCNLQFSFDAKKQTPLRVVVKPAKHSQSAVKDSNKSGQRECTFDIVYERL